MKNKLTPRQFSITIAITLGTCLLLLSTVYISRCQKEQTPNYLEKTHKTNKELTTEVDTSKTTTKQKQVD